MYPQEPAYLVENPDFAGHTCRAIMSAHRNDALSHHTLGVYLPVVRSYIGPELPHLSYATLYDAVYTATTHDESGKRCWAFAATGITESEPDHDPEGMPAGTPILPGHYISLANETPNITRWCRRTGLHERHGLPEKADS
jgi:hypothetical protein